MCVCDKNRVVYLFIFWLGPYEKATDFSDKLCYFFFVLIFPVWSITIKIMFLLHAKMIYWTVIAFFSKKPVSFQVHLKEQFVVSYESVVINKIAI